MVIYHGNLQTMLQVTTGASPTTFEFTATTPVIVHRTQHFSKYNTIFVFKTR
jgi:hypothetical protein